MRLPQTTGAYPSRNTRVAPGTGTNMPTYGAQPTTFSSTTAYPAVERRDRPPKTGFFSRLFGSKVTDTPRAPSGADSQSRSVQPMQPYVGYGSSRAAFAPGYGTQGNAITQMYSPQPAPIITIPQHTHRHRRRRSH